MKNTTPILYVHDPDGYVLISKLMPSELTGIMHNVHVKTYKNSHPASWRAVISNGKKRINIQSPEPLPITIANRQTYFKLIGANHAL